MTHDPDERARQLLARALTLEPDDGPPADFVDAVKNKRAPLVDGAQGRRALELATRIVAAM